MNNSLPFSALFRGLVFTCLACFWSACSNESPDEEQPDKSNRPTIQFSMLGDTASFQDSVISLSEKRKNKKDTSQVSQIIFSFPQIKQFAKKTVKDSLNVAILKMMLLNESGEIAYTSLSERQANFIEEYETNKADMAAFGGDFDMKWFCEVKIEVVLNTPNLLTLRFFEANFTGGAHANMCTRYLNFNMQTGQKIENKELFVENAGFEQQLLPVAEAKFKQFIQARELSPDEFQFEEGAFPMTQNIAVGQKGLILSYDPYELGAFALGSIELEIPYEEIYPILNKKLLR